jgi:hypothetical protein
MKIGFLSTLEFCLKFKDESWLNLKKKEENRNRTKTASGPNYSLAGPPLDSAPVTRARPASLPARALQRSAAFPCGCCAVTDSRGPHFSLSAHAPFLVCGAGLSDSPSRTPRAPPSPLRRVRPRSPESPTKPRNLITTNLRDLTSPVHKRVSPPPC